MTNKRKHSPEFKVQVALAALKEEKTISQISSHYEIHPTQVRRWRDSLKQNLAISFTNGPLRELKEKDKLIDNLYQQVGQLTMELEWLKKKLHFN